MTLPEANAISVSNHRHGCGCEHYNGRGRGRGRGCHNSWNRDSHDPPQNKKNGPNNQKLNYSKRSYGKVTRPHSKQAYETDCYRCGIKGHWSHTCHTTTHLVDLYQASVKGKGKQIKTNFIGGQGTMDCDVNFIDGYDAVPLTHLDVPDFFEDLSGKIDHLIGNGNGNV